jgi:hypothetical protein
MTNKTIALVAVVAAAASISGCGTVQRALGAAKVSPDEFRVVSQAPLTLPPDYSLRPPRPGEPRPQELAPDAEARAALFGENIGVSASQGERSLVSNAGAEAVDPDIRETIDYENQGVVHRNREFVDSVLNFGDGSAIAPLDPDAEARRLEEQEAIRRATGGGEVTIDRRGGGGFKLPGT